MDVVLKIYEGGSGGYVGSGALLYTIKNDIKDYVFMDEDGYNIDTFTAKLVNPGKYDIDANDIWRLFYQDGTLLGSGPIIYEPRLNYAGVSEIYGESWTSILKRFIVDQTQAVGDKGDDIFKDLLTNKLSAYSINTANVGTPDNTLNNLDFDGVYAYELMRYVAENSYKAVSGINQPHYFHISETADAIGTLKAYFKPKYESAVVASVQPKHINYNQFNLRVRNDLNATKCLVYGATQNFNWCPIDGDWWTEWDSDAEVQAMWYTTGDADFIRYNGVEAVGTYAVYMQLTNAGVTATASLNLLDADAYNSTYTPTELFTSGSGYKYDWSKDQWMRIFLKLDSTLQTQFDAGEVLVRVWWTTNTFETNYYEIHPTNNPLLAGSDYAQLNLRLNDFMRDKDDTFITEVNVQVETIGANTFDNGADIMVDGIKFYEGSGRVKGSYDNSATPAQEVILNDVNILADWMANDIAEAYVLGSYSTAANLSKKYTVGSVGLNIPVPAVKAGDSVSVYSPQHGISDSQVYVQRVAWTPYHQTLHLGRNTPLEEILSRTTANIRRR